MNNWVDPTRKAIVLPRVLTPEQVGNYSWKDQLDLENLRGRMGSLGWRSLRRQASPVRTWRNARSCNTHLMKSVQVVLRALYLMNISRGSRTGHDRWSPSHASLRRHHTILRLPEERLHPRQERRRPRRHQLSVAKGYKRDMIKNMSRGVNRQAKEASSSEGAPGWESI